MVQAYRLNPPFRGIPLGTGQAVGFRSDLLANTQYVTFEVIGLEQKILNERTQILNQLDREFPHVRIVLVR